MNDYLTNLAARALAPTPAIVPRQGSLFEPVTLRPALPVPLRGARQREEGLEESIEREASPQDHAPAVHRVPPWPAAPSRRAPADEMPRSSSEPPSAAARPALRAAIAPMVVEPAVVAAAPTPHAETPSPPAVAKAQAVSARAATKPPAPREPTLAEILPRDPPVNSARPATRRDRGTGDAPPGDDIQRSTRRSDAQAGATISPAVVMAARDRSDESALRPRGQLAPSPAPTIRVTIGRVEVRALAPPAAAPAKPRAAASSAKLSLEDYLTERSGGRR